jgi:prepilin-type processing-associated H-X9-DG protein
VNATGNNADNPRTPSGNRAMNRWAEPDNGAGISGPNSLPNRNYVNNNSSPKGGPADCPWSSSNCGPNGEIFSLHPSGAHVLLCDGSVTFLNETISFRALRSLITRDEGVPAATYQ